jgi:hypothetical protein
MKLTITKAAAVERLKAAQIKARAQEAARAKEAEAAYAKAVADHKRAVSKAITRLTEVEADLRAGRDVDFYALYATYGRTLTAPMKPEPIDYAEEYQEAIDFLALVQEDTLTVDTTKDNVGVVGTVIRAIRGR